MIELGPNTPLAPIAKRTLIIAMTERSGSTNLCSVLGKLGVFGQPDEFFNPQGPMEYLPGELGAADASDYMAKLAARAEVFCFKASRTHWRPFAQRARDVFPNARYVFLDRLDVEAQAISLYRARLSWNWHEKHEWMSKPKGDTLDAAEVEACREHLLLGKARWAEFFFKNDIKPLTIMYEQMQADPAKAVQMICGEAGVFVLQNKVPEGEYRVLRDGLTDEWKDELRTLRVGEV